MGPLTQESELVSDDQRVMAGHPRPAITAAVFDTKSYDREALEQASADHALNWQFLEFRLTEDSASAAKNARAVCVFRQ